VSGARGIPIYNQLLVPIGSRSKLKLHEHMYLEYCWKHLQHSINIEGIGNGGGVKLVEIDQFKIIFIAV
jgi:hypothetical protein